ncbi:hypothetical protein DF056_20735 [Burkholderia cepacia]|uniref:ClpX C4-type zinc finger protein n=1 Tax=Burkholderia cepacia TaxID=292 RepID=UPI000F5FB8C6|nr:ClpX C4-type zinc finger protein [Burkholderia cepacia]RQZ78822.1 hypothetical protein DF056_20735 [Burkholderia cepacia]
MKITLSKWACDFCNRTEDEAAHIVTTPSEVAICDECVATCTEIIGYSEKGGAQRVHNWKYRGIPPEVKIQHPDLFLTELLGPTKKRSKEGK